MGTRSIVVLSAAIAAAAVSCGSEVEPAASQIPFSSPQSGVSVLPPVVSTNTDVSPDVSAGNVTDTSIPTARYVPPISISFVGMPTLRPAGQPFESGIEDFPTVGQVFIPEQGEPGQVVSASGSERGSELLSIVENLVPIEGSSRNMFSTKGPDGYTSILVLEAASDVLITLHMAGFDEKTARIIAENVSVSLKEVP